MWDLFRAGTQWGTTAAERERRYACDDIDAALGQELWRAVSVGAPPETVFGWLCQLRVAPYSYDLIDNFGRRSPRTLTPGLTELAVGQKAMRVFRVQSFASNEQLTVVTGRPVRCAMTYAVFPDDAGCRLVGKLRTRWPGGPVGLLANTVFPWADLVMMRKQLRTLAHLAETQ